MIEIIVGDCADVLKTMPDGLVNTCITSPPYFGLRDYGVDGQIGLESSPDEFVSRLVAIFREVRRVLRDDGTLYLNLGDSYNAYNGNRGRSLGSANNRHHEIMPTLVGGSGLTVRGLKNKDLIGIPWRVAFALQADGWYLRQDIIWSKPNPMPESVRDRCTRAHEYIFMLSKSARYYYDSESIREQAVSSTINKFTDGGSDKQRGHSRRHAGFNGRYAQKLAQDGLPDSRNRRSVWTVATKPFKGSHFATFPPELIEPCVLAGCPSGGMVLDPFGGAGTTGLVAKMHGRSATLIELNKKYADMARDRIDSWIPGVKRSGRKPSADSMQYDFTADFQM